MIGRVKLHSFKGCFSVLNGEDGQEYIAMTDDMLADGIGHRYLISKERVSFSVSYDDSRKRHKAIDVRPLDRPEETFRLDTDHRETCTMISWDGTFGFCDRYFPGHCLFVHSNNIVTLGEEYLRRGHHIICGVQPGTEGRQWEATEIEIIIE